MTKTRPLPPATSSRRSPLRAAAAGGLMLAVLCACSQAASSPQSGAVPAAASASTSAGTASSQPAQTAVPVAATTDPTSCGVFKSGSDVRIRVTGNADECSTLATDLSKGGAFWSVRSQPASAQLSLVCVMTRTQLQAEVFDSGGQIYGRSVCGDFVSSGWSEDSQAEDAAAGAVAAAASASAAAQAAANADEQRARDEAAAAGMVKQLRDAPGTLAADLATLKEHLQTLEGKVVTLRATAAKGAGADCSNAQDVTYKAENDIGYDAENVVGYDAENSVGYHLNTIRQQVTALETQLEKLDGESATAPADAASVLTAAQAADAHAVSTTNAAIDRANAGMTTAYRLANSLATGDCDGDGPGDVTPVDHIS